MGRIEGWKYEGKTYDFFFFNHERSKFERDCIRSIIHPTFGKDCQGLEGPLWWSSFYLRGPSESSTLGLLIELMFEIDPSIPFHRSSRLSSSLQSLNRRSKALEGIDPIRSNKFLMEIIDVTYIYLSTYLRFKIFDLSWLIWKGQDFQAMKD